MIQSCEISVKIDYSDPISRRRENVAWRRLRACWRRVYVASFVLTFSRVPLRLQRRLGDGSVGFVMYFHLVYSPEFFAAASGRKSTGKLFRQATELMDIIDHDFVKKYTTSAPFDFHPCPFHMAICFLWGSGLIGCFGAHMGAKNPSQNSAQTANFVYL